MLRKIIFSALLTFLLENGLLLAADNLTAIKPNFIIIFTDDLGYGDVGTAGSSLIQTPNIDKMEREGVSLTSHFASANVCTPSRAGLLTGRYPVRSGLASWVLFAHSAHGLSHDEITISSSLNRAGYRTAMFGKWHLGTIEVSWPTQHGFEYFYGIPYSNDMVPLPLYRNNEIIEEPVNQTTLTQRLTYETIMFIESVKDEPFLIYLAHPMPHVPLFVSKEFEGRSKAGLYGDVIEELDWSVGEILKALKNLDLDENTLVIFTSDNGPWFEGSAGEFRERKGAASWEGGFRVPFIARWPGKIPPGVVSDAITMNFDVFPTLLELAGINVPVGRTIDGKNIWEVLQGKNISPHEYLYFFNDGEITAVRSQRWKFVVSSHYRTRLMNFEGERIRFRPEGGRYSIDGEMHYYHPGLLFDFYINPSEQFSYTREKPDVVAEMVEWLEKGIAELEIPEKNTVD